ncbi:MAG TPA: helix-turn-helix domain-containing protein [Verrucomicrobiae bacterium]|jgi:AcrR family transcriptional regulator|nr:helix-turn-helix domain-containing protein [Verrucomicrobiae bacterium]
MPRKADKQLEGRIVDAAYQLWSKGGEHAVTMRAVALAAKTTTPTLYERFRDKHDLIEFLRVRARERMYEALQPADSAAEACRLGLEFTLTNGNEYLLLTSDWARRLARKERMPSYEFLKQRLAEDLGGTAENYAGLAMALVAQVHGTAILLLGEGVEEHIAQQFKYACLEACQALIECGGKKIGGGAKQ